MATNVRVGAPGVDPACVAFRVDPSRASHRAVCLAIRLLTVAGFTDRDGRGTDRTLSTPRVLVNVSKVYYLLLT
jgi:hypothetical protein